MPTAADVIRIARLFLFVREAGKNAGQRVEAIQRWCGGMPGDSWCAYYVSMVLDLAFGGKAPIPRTGVCQKMYDQAKTEGWVASQPAVGDLFLYVNAGDHAHHVGIVTGVNPLVGIAGNTSADGKSNNGDRVAERPVASDVFIHYPRAADV
jgi:hypothetical protein